LEGGIVAPLIVAGHGVNKRAGVVSTYLTVMDLAPTFLELGGATYPAAEEAEPILGESIVDLLSGKADQVHDEDYVTTQFHSGLAYIRLGNLKLVTDSTPFDESLFKMYDLSTDPGETIDLAGQQAEVYETLTELWRAERKRLGIILPEDL
jgi:arylsulfatase